MHRFRLDQGEVRIGRDQTNDIWIDSPAVRPQTCLVYAREGLHHLKVYEGAKVLLNGQAVRGLHQLYSGDRIGVGDRELLYGRDDSLPQVAVGLTVILDGAVQYATVYRRNRVRLGRVDADLVLGDPSVSDRHLVIECYSDIGLFAFDLGSQAGTYVRGERIDERSRLADGDIVQLGRVSLRVHLLPVEAYGLLLTEALPERPLVPIAAPKPMDRSPSQRYDPSAAGPSRRQADARSSGGGFVRPMHSANAVANASAAQPPLDRRPPSPEPPAEKPAPLGQQPGQSAPHATEIGSLANILRDAQQQGAFGAPQHTVMADAVRARVDLDALARSQRQIDEAAADSAPRLANQRPLEPAPVRRDMAVRPPQRDSFDEPTQPPPAGGFHEQRTEMLDTNRVYEGLGSGRPRQQDGAIPLTAVLDTELPPPLPPRTRAQRMAEDEELKRPAADRYRLGRTTGAVEPQEYAFRDDGRDDPPRDDGRYRLGRQSGAWDREDPRPLDRPAAPLRRAEPAPPEERYRLGRSSGAFDRPPVQDDRPRVAPRPLSDTERQANPQWSNGQNPVAWPGEPDQSQRPRQARTIDGSRRLDPDRER